MGTTSLITVPSAVSLLNGAGAYATEMFSALILIAIAVAGFMIAPRALRFLVGRGIVGGSKVLFGGSRRRGRRR